MSTAQKQKHLKPLVGVVCDVQHIAPHDFHAAGDKYLRALSRSADVIPVLIPALLEDQDVDQWLARLDGLFLTGAYSMVDPAHYNEIKVDKQYDYDAQRDATAFAFVHKAIANNLPLLGVCRGLQDINVALGGSLHQVVQEHPELNDHREDKNATLDEQYAPAHTVTLSENGMLQNIFKAKKIDVNSLHSQAINRVGSGLEIEAKADDGLVEAIRVEGVSFGLAVQWHPEWKVTENKTQTLLFEAFGDACRARQLAGIP
ncbi:gamma-glutamyl-gamma-aminobutyrate hydrolase family protein [Reinekea marina]|uniref:Gamma-glutamyl-gamma-aminobutyrate hydrolase family protein n=1 Tax=Reinekea marina TaxID=1310421 RepID=A0ABV7WQ08_9GAMM|nr:gamma-glutamyl-gamma-aminobutyrate hydrolase family protein [Reinekea marina]MDN3647770.1 gamma-glutamyl-gamma-aminobutyrate hydrolase family protein [Reinekea marina]